MRITVRAFAALGVALLSLNVPARAQVTVTIDPGIQYQTFRSWGGTTPGEEGLADLARSHMLDALVHDFGLTRLRYEPPAGHRPNSQRWEWLNDNGDPDVMDWSAIDTSALDQRANDWLVPFKERVEASGEPFDIYISPSFFDGGSSGTAPAWLLNSPGECAEYATAVLLRLRDAHGITANYYSICNEAGNNNAWTATVVADAIKALGPRLAALGLPTKIQFPESISVDTAWDSYITPLQNDAEIWPYIGCLSYHLYGSNGKRVFIRDLGIAKGIPTAQTEYMGLTTQHLYDDLIKGGVSYWELYGLTGHGNAKINTNRDGTHFSFGSEYWIFRQATRYIRPGDVRIEATSSLSTFKALAFGRSGKVTVLLPNNIAGSVARTATLSGLPAGTYGLCQSLNGNAYTELGLQTVGADGTLVLNVPLGAVMTLYPHPGGNLPPAITTWQASPDYLTAPANSTTLLATATDPELDVLSYTWSPKSSPAGATVVLATPNNATCEASGLTVAGDYVFTLAVDDREKTVTRDLLLRVHATNEPPVPVDVHNRLPVQIVQPVSSTNLRGGGWDLENDPLTFNWTVVSQPTGASANVVTPNTATTALSRLTVAGDYLLRLEIKDPTHTVTQDLPITVYANPTAPEITNAAASPANPYAYRTVQLSATTSDADGDTLTHWWKVKSAPAGARPVFDTPGHATTNVSGLSVAGTYVFTVRAIDLSQMATRDVTVTVGAPLPADANQDGMIDFADLLLLVDSFGLNPGDPGYDDRCDSNDDGMVDVVDLLTLVYSFGQG
jgi:hypothetical protein